MVADIPYADQFNDAGIYKNIWAKPGLVLLELASQPWRNVCLPDVLISNIL